MVKQKSLKLNYILNLIKTTLSIIFPLITYPYVSKILSVEGLGKVNFSNSFVNYFVLFASFGINTYAVREGAKYRNDKKLLSKFATEMLLVNITTAIIAYLFLILSLNLPDLKQYRSLLIVFSLTIIFNTFGFEWLFQLLEEYRYITIRAIIFQIISLVLLFVFVKEKNDVIEYASILVFANVGAQALNMFYIRKQVDLFNVKAIEIKKYYKPMFLIFLTLLSMNLYRFIDVTFLGFIKNDKSVGLYSLPTKISNILIQVASSITVILTPRLAYYYKNSLRKEFEKLVYFSIDFLLMISIPMCFGVLSLSKELIFTLGSAEFAPSIITMKLLSPLILISALNGLLVTPILVVMNREKIVLRIFIIAFCFNAISNVILINIFDYNGAALTTVMTELIILICSVYSASSDFKISLIFRNFFVYFLVAFVIPIWAYILRNFVHNNIIFIGVLMVLSASSYFLVLLLLKNETVDKYFRLLVEKIRYKRGKSND